MSDIVEFLRARLDEDESEAVLAQRIREGRPEVWASGKMRYGTAEVRTKGGALVAAEVSDAVRHIARHDPARVLREVAAKRSILGRHPEILSICQSCGETYPCRTLGALASAYSDHPDYDAGWRP